MIELYFITFLDCEQCNFFKERKLRLRLRQFDLFIRMYIQM